jgi:hypothetical protein
MPVSFAGFGYRKTDRATLALWSPALVTAVLPGIWLWRNRHRFERGMQSQMRDCTEFLRIAETELTKRSAIQNHRCDKKSV